MIRLILISDVDKKFVIKVKLDISERFSRHEIIQLSTTTGVFAGKLYDSYVVDNGHMLNPLLLTLI